MSRKLRNIRLRNGEICNFSLSFIHELEANLDFPKSTPQCCLESCSSFPARVNSNVAIHCVSLESPLFLRCRKVFSD